MMHSAEYRLCGMFLLDSLKIYNQFMDFHMDIV